MVDNDGKVTELVKNQDTLQNLVDQYVNFPVIVKCSQLTSSRSARISD